MTGKLGQSLRKYNDNQGQPDFELEKFAINSLLSATHSSQMDDEDKNDIIKKVNTSGNDSGDDSNDDSGDNSSDDSDNDISDLEETQILEFEDIFLKNPKKNNMFQPNSNDILKGTCDEVKEESEVEETPLVEKLSNKKKNSIFDKIYIKNIMKENFNQGGVETEEPQTKPITKPSETPSRRNRPFLPSPSVQPRPKAVKESEWSNLMKGVKNAEYGGPWSVVVIENRKFVTQELVKIKELIPANYRILSKNYPNALIYIENSAGLVVWSNKK